MVSYIGLDEAIEGHSRHLVRYEPDRGAEARGEVLQFLGAEGDDVELSGEVRIILVSSNSGHERITTVLWLNVFQALKIRWPTRTDATAIGTTSRSPGGTSTGCARPGTGPTCR